MSASDGTVVWASAQDGWFTAVNDFARSTPWLHEPLRLYAEYGVVVFAALLLWSWWIARRSDDLRLVTRALWAPVGALVALGVNQVLVAAVAEPRPYTALNHVLVLVGRSGDFSFPSDHAVMAGAVAAGVWLVDRRLGLLAGALALLMAFTRVYVGAHFPLDVVAGLLVGVVIAVATCLLVVPLAQRLVALLVRTPARVLLTSPAPARLTEHARMR